MNRVLLLLAIAGLTFLILLFGFRTDLWEEFMLWLVGLAGPVIKVLHWSLSQVSRLFNKESSDHPQDEMYQPSHPRAVDESVG